MPQYMCAICVHTLTVCSCVWVWSACGRLSVAMVTLGKAYLEEGEIGEREGALTLTLSLSVRHLGILTLWLRFSDRIFTHLTSHMSSNLSVSPFSSSPSPYLLAFSRTSLHLLTRSYLSNHTEIQAIKHIQRVYPYFLLNHFISANVIEQNVFIVYVPHSLSLFLTLTDTHTHTHTHTHWPL